MPRTHFERVLALGTLAGCLAFLVLAVKNWEAMRPAANVASVTNVEHAAAAPARTTPRLPVTTVQEAVTTTAKPKPPPSPVVFSIAAAGGPSWLEVRAGDAAGEELYFGMLQDGEEETFSRLPVWVRVGAPQSVTVRLGDSAVDSLPATDGATEFVVTADGLTAQPAG
jgi:hypothetical protein